ncbi:hypothetical protein [Methylocystis parvus]|uniref:hypothetical protein n=1 Tax=Methylocystis parvus TaxID=134 RepID=UPI003C7861BD
MRAVIHINYFSDVDWINGASCFLSDKEEKITLSMTVYFNEASADWLTCAADWVEQAEKQDKILKDASWPDGEIRVHAGMVFYCAFKRSFVPPRIPFPVEL